jgi:hypothetical protein
MSLKPIRSAIPDCESFGFRFGDRGTHTSRTMMLNELRTTLADTPADATRTAYVAAIVDDNCLSKPTSATRVLSAQRLSEIYALDPDVPLFRVMRNLWQIDERGQPLLALLVALARDPLLAATAPAVVPLKAREEFARGPMRQALRDAVGDRLNDATLDKVARNAASSWSQAGHLTGRTFKLRQQVQPTFATVALALLLAHTCGRRGEALLESDWLKAIDCQPSQARTLAIDAKRHGLIDLRMVGEVIDIEFDRMDPWKVRR